MIAYEKNTQVLSMVAARLQVNVVIACSLPFFDWELMFDKLVIYVTGIHK
jgi:hypothetical protein